MRRIITCTLGLFLVGGLMSQSVGKNNPAQIEAPTSKPNFIKEKDGIVIRSAESASRGVAFFTEDFLNGFDGNNELGLPITVTDSGGDAGPIWRMADENSPCGEFSDPDQALVSETSANGWAIYDTDCWNTPVSDGFFATQGFLELPPMDLSGRGTVLLEWEQTFRYCCQSPSPLSIGVSVDGGTTYTEFSAIGDFIPEANVESAPSDILIDVSCAAAELTDVRIRFSYNEEFNDAYSHYYWGIDDIKLFENAVPSDLTLNQISTGDIVTYYEYSALPIDMQTPEADGGLQVFTMFTNIGLNDIENVVATYSITNSAGTEVYNETNEIGLVLSPANSLVCPYLEDTVIFNTFWTADVVDDYLLTVTISDNGSLDNDGTPDNNVLVRPFSITGADTGAIGTDFPDSFDGQFSPRIADGTEDQYDPHGYGTFFHVPATSFGVNIEGVGVQFGALTVPETEVTVGIYSIAQGGVNDPLGADASLEIAATYEIDEDDIPANLDGAFETYIPFDQPLMDLDTNTFYFVFVQRDVQSDSRFTVYGNLNTDTDFSGRDIAENSENAFVWFGGSSEYGVRAYRGDPALSVEENEISGLGLGQNMPNPFTGASVITYDLEQSLPLSFEVMDVTGKTVVSQNLGTLPAGQHTIDINGADYEAGIYFYSLVSGESRTTKKMVITD